ncbi:MAG: hypothetical protein KKF89_02565, partial [Nanoarchaeota archaeon]|nr:hypothetical protein [Nanoarchaeota archaeon]
AEYKSIPWNFERWILTTKENIKDCKENLSKQIEEYKQKFEEKKILVKKLKPPEKVMKVIRFLDECNAQRDWSKGKFCEAYLYLRSLTDEIARRFNLSFEEIYSMKVEEIEMMLDGKPINKNIIRARLEKGQILLIKEGKEEMHEPMTMKQVMKQEGIYDFFHKKEIFTEARGLPACKGFTKGRARVIDSSKGIPEFIEGEILVTYMTTMEFTPLFSKAKAIVCDEGGISSHAAIVSREFGIPCIVGAKIAMKFIKTGDLIEVDANKGVVRILKHFSHS